MPPTTNTEILERIEAKIDAHAKAHERIEERLGSLERSRAYAAGAIAVGAAAASLGFAYVKSLWVGGPR